MIGNIEYSDTDVQKMRTFVERLFINPSFSQIPVPEVEGILINFLAQNQQQLVGTFSSAEYYPHLQWRDIQILFFTTVKELTLEKMKPRLRNLIEAHINFNFLGSLRSGKNVDMAAANQSIRLFLEEIILSRDVRQAFDVTFKLLENEYVERYVNRVFERREYIFNMITRRDSLHTLDADQLANFIKTTLLLRNVVYVKLPVAQGSVEGQVIRLNLEDVRDKPAVREIFLKKLEEYLQKELSYFPDQVLKTAIDSNRDCNEETDVISSSAMFLAIIAKRGKDYNPWLKVDKGAEKPDKSWFKIALKNFEFHGIDKNMLEEFYKIAADENW